MLPNFLIIGAAKCGTTSIYHYLNQHPEIYFSPVKEPKFFAFEAETFEYNGPQDNELLQQNSIIDFEKYCALFDNANEAKAVGEASTIYMYSPNAAQRIRQLTPNSKLIAIIRNPLERAYSNYLYNVRNGIEPIKDFRTALDAEQFRIRDNWAPHWHYMTRSLYYPQLSRYFETFEDNQLRVYLYDDLKLTPEKLVQDMFEFLEVDESFRPDVSRQHNISGIPRNQLIHKLVTRSNPAKAMVKPLLPKSFRKSASRAVRDKNLQRGTISKELKAKLGEAFADDVSKVQALLGRDLSHWLG